MKLPTDLPRHPAHWLALLRPGDLLVFGIGLAICIVAFSTFWSTAPVDRAQIRQGGAVAAEFKLGPGLPLRQHHVEGPLGTTVIELEGSRARVASDPGPKQLCVQQGWLERPNAVAICAPNQVSLHLLPKQPAYDSLHY